MRSLTWRETACHEWQTRRLTRVLHGLQMSAISDISPAQLGLIATGLTYVPEQPRLIGTAMIDVPAQLGLLGTGLTKVPEKQCIKI